MTFKSCLALSAAIVPLLAVQGAAATLTNGSGDGDVAVEVSEYGFVFGAFFDPVGSVGGGDVVFSSYVSRGDGDVIETLDFSDPTDTTIVRQSASELVTRFDVDDLRFTLTQTVRDAARGAARAGSVLTQEFAITNLAAEAADFDLYRYLDGDLFLTGAAPGDGGGVMERDGRTVLYQTDAVGDPGPDNPFLGMTAEGGTVPETGRFSIGPCCDVPAPLDDAVAGDTDGDGVIDVPYDVTMTLRNAFSLEAGQSATYTTSTLFGTGGPIAPPAPGSSEEMPLLPSNDPPVDGVIDEFVFDIPVDLVSEDQIVWVDPAVAVGYTYEVTGAEFASVTAPSLDSVPDPDGYMLSVDGTTVALAAGETYDFATPVTMFQILGIDPALGLDPESGSTFVTGLSFAAIDGGLSSITLTKTPVGGDTGGPVSPVPLPASALFLLGGLGMIGAAGRRPRA